MINGGSGTITIDGVSTPFAISDPDTASIPGFPGVVVLVLPPYLDGLGAVALRRGQTVTGTLYRLGGSSGEMRVKLSLSSLFGLAEEVDFQASGPGDGDGNGLGTVVFADGDSQPKTITLMGIPDGGANQSQPSFLLTLASNDGEASLWIAGQVNWIVGVVQPSYGA